MPRVHHVKKARKDNSAVKKGESYFWWKTRRTVGKSFIGTKHRSKTRPKPSQLTSSEFMRQLLSLTEQLGDACSGADVENPVAAAQELESSRDSVADELEALGDEQGEKRDNMPDGLRDGPTGEMLDERAEGCREMAEELRGVDCNIDDPEDLAIQQSALDDITQNLEGVEYSGG